MDTHKIRVPKLAIVQLQVTTRTYTAWYQNVRKDHAYWKRRIAGGDQKRRTNLREKVREDTAAAEVSGHPHPQPGPRSGGGHREVLQPRGLQPPGHHRVPRVTRGGRRRGSGGGGRATAPADALWPLLRSQLGVRRRAQIAGRLRESSVGSGASAAGAQIWG